MPLTIARFMCKTKPRDFTQFILIYNKTNSSKHPTNPKICIKSYSM